MLIRLQPVVPASSPHRVHYPISAPDRAYLLVSSFQAESICEAAEETFLPPRSCHQCLRRDQIDPRAAPLYFTGWQMKLRADGAGKEWALNTSVTHGSTPIHRIRDCTWTISRSDFSNPGGFLDDRDAPPGKLLTMFWQCIHVSACLLWIQVLDLEKKQLTIRSRFSLKFMQIIAADTTQRVSCQVCTTRHTAGQKSIHCELLWKFAEFWLKRRRNI